MKIVFLDFDGVLNSEKFFSKRMVEIKNGDYDPLCQIDPEAVKRLSKIVDATGAKIVVSSVWRYSHKLVELREILGHFGFKGQIIGATPRSHESRYRGEEIDAWLSENGSDRGDPVGRFVILDDDADMEPYMDRLIQTSWKIGLQDAHVNRAIKMLGRKK